MIRMILVSLGLEGPRVRWGPPGWWEGDGPCWVCEGEAAAGVVTAAVTVEITASARLKIQYFC